MRRARVAADAWPSARRSPGTTGVDVDGYRDYRGVPVVGAWTWLPDDDIGVVTEVDYAEAFRPLTILKRTFWGLFALLALSALAIFVFTLVVARLQREAQKAAIEAKQLGQYKLEQKLGAGGMGVVYKGHHAMLRRPTAIKMLDVDKVNEGIDRAVRARGADHQPAQQSEHGGDLRLRPHAGGRVLLRDGVPRRHRPADARRATTARSPVPRVIHILRQICGSLYEAHSLGLVHRDIKPANIMLNRRGGEPDVVKVLDFGLVKALDDAKQAGLTRQESLTGTPLYMSPEAIQMPSSVDARSDIYAVGAVGYFLLTGQPVFEAGHRASSCARSTSTRSRCRRRSGRERRFRPSWKRRIMACLEKSRAKRPQTARDLAALISRCAEAHAWSIEDADAWWGRHDRGQAGLASQSGLMGTPPNLSASASRTANQRHDMTIDQPRKVAGTLRVPSPTRV